MDFEEKALLLLAVLADEYEEPQRKRRIWIDTVNLYLEEEGELHTIFHKLRQHRERFLIYFRMTTECFDEILSLIEEDIKNNSPIFEDLLNLVLFLYIFDHLDRHFSFSSTSEELITLMPNGLK
nr:unnamed protein product [Callosobruchus chinensis]